MLTSDSPAIRILSPDLASQIAAGEVVERPASVVKELIENALDAGARRIDVRIEAGGLALIEVADDGLGMSVEEAPLSLGRHATSKLTSFDDLQELGSYGFRGEALPSVASVSRLEIRTRSGVADEGVSVRAEGTTEAEISPIGHPVGTTLVVRDLFFNVPARRKFLRSSNTESGHVAEVMVDAALARPEVSFSLTRDGRKVRQYQRTEQRRVRAEQVFAEPKMWQVVGERGPLSVDAYLCPPSRNQKGAGGLKLLVNGRPIRDRALAATIAHAFGSLLERGRYPRGVVYLELPPRLVDVNVHPQKTEVRFAELRAVTDAVYGLVSRAVSNQWMEPSRDPQHTPSPPGASSFRDSAASPPFSKTTASATSPSFSQSAASASNAASASTMTGSDTLDADPRASADSKSGTWSQSLEPLEARDSTRSVPAPQPRILRDGPSPISGHRYTAEGIPPDGAKAFRKTSEIMRGDLEALLSSETASKSPDAERSSKKNWKNLRFLCQVRATYLMCEGPDGIYILDQHAADERVLFTRLKRSYEASAVSSQALLFPLSVEVSPAESEVLEQRGAEIKALGLDVRVRSAEMASIHAVPKLLQRTSPERLLRDVLTELSRQSERGFSAMVDKALSTMACHEAVRAGDRLSQREAEALLQSLDGADFEANCAHGRPVVAITTFKDLERKVGRR